MSPNRRILVTPIALLAVLVLGQLTYCQAELTRKTKAVKNSAKASKSPIYVSPKYCVSYHRHPKLGCCRSCQRTKMVLLVVDPACPSCAAEVCVSLPCCCKSAPCVSSRCGLFGRRIVRYEWPGGYTVRVVFNRFNNVAVHSYGC